MPRAPQPAPHQPDPTDPQRDPAPDHRTDQPPSNHGVPPALVTLAPATTKPSREPATSSGAPNQAHDHEVSLGYYAIAVRRNLASFAMCSLLAIASAACTGSNSTSKHERKHAGTTSVIGKLQAANLERFSLASSARPTSQPSAGSGAQRISASSCFLCSPPSARAPGLLLQPSSQAPPRQFASQSRSQSHSATGSCARLRSVASLEY